MAELLRLATAGSRGDGGVSEAAMEDRKGEGYFEMAELLRFATAGSVDDGKSTLIGRLLYDSKAIFEDQPEAVERTSRQRGEQHTNLALLTDGLRAEREQGITIDVAYRYFATPRRKFVIADTPGHIQYTRNMVTGASTADLALILVDAQSGLVEQSRRHAFLATLLRVPHLVVCINKMDLVGYDQDRFEEIKADFRSFATKLEIADLSFVPISALHGDNVVHRSANMPWYEGGSLLHMLEEVHIASDRNLIDARFPVQYVIRPTIGTATPREDRRYAGTEAGGVFRPGGDAAALHAGAPTPSAADLLAGRARPTIGTATPREDRRCGGTVAGGVFRPGDEVVVLPSGFTTRIA